MSTHPHSNPENGYAIRISKNLPKNAANLSYVHVDKPTPSKNINLKDYTGNIQENKVSQNEEVFKAYLNEEGFLEINQEIFKSNNPHLILTNEYASNLEKTPLFFKYRTRHPLNVENIEVSIPLSGNKVSASRPIHEYFEGQENKFVYEGEKVQVSRTETQGLESDDAFKVTLEKESDLFFVVIYSAKELLNEGYEIYYPSIQDGKTKNVKEIMNLESVFTEETIVKNHLSKNNYKVIENEDNTFSIEIDKEAGNFLITEENRRPYTFDYQLQAKVKTRIGEKNPLGVNIGIIYINENVFNAVKTTSALKKIVYQNPYMPEFLSFSNPHRRSEGVHEKINSEYWEASAAMPMEHWLDYDVIIISGYGRFDVSHMNQNIQSFLDLGGILIIESAGQKNEVLEFTNNQIADISYSKSTIEEEVLENVNELTKSRYYDMKDISSVGYVSPQLQFFGKEAKEDWEIFAKYRNNEPAFMRKNVGGPGQLIYSNMGLMQDILFNNTESLKFFINILITLLEERSFITPVYNEYVHHRDDLYEEEYKTDLGKNLYVNDKSDEDSTQIVAKKIIDNDISNKVRDYLPVPYRVWENIEIKTILNNESYIRIQNSRLSMGGKNKSFKETTENAIPGYRYISFSGNNGVGSHVTENISNEPTHISVKTTNTQAFFEQDIGQLIAGNYQLEVLVKTKDTQNGGFGIYTALGEPLATKEVYGTHNWRVVRLDFDVKESENFYLRLGAYEKPSTGETFFTQINMKNKGPVRMNGTSTGREPLYAYATSPRGKNNSLITYEQTYSNPTILKESKLIETNLRVRSFVYKLDSESGTYLRTPGNEKITKVSIDTKDKEIVLGNILEFTPALYPGVEWSRKQNVFYEIDVEDSDFLDVSIYDATIDKFFFTPEGRWIINHEDIWWNGLESTIQLKLSTNYYNLMATDNEFAVAYEPNRDFKVELPYSEDERDRWHLRIQNGSFTKNVVNASELEELEKLNKEEQYDNYLIGEHLYEMPEYGRQTFYPYYGEKLINEELSIYVNEHKIEVQNTPLIINEITVTEERLSPDTEGKVWSSQNIFWDSEHLPQVYLDQNNTGDLIVLNRGFKINYREGKVIFDEKVRGTIYASYRHDNFKIYKRDFKNKNIKNELLTTRDGYGFQTLHKNITVMPSPKLYLGEPSESSLMHPSRYWVDYEQGIVYFFEHISTRVYAEYSYYTEKELEYSDVNKNTGEIYLEDRISFKDEVYVTYLSEENTLEYKGYYDESLQEFIKLDLNPSVGHQFDYLYEGKLETLEGYDLLDKEIFVYLLPQKSTYYKKEIREPHTVRHVFHEEQWLRIKEARPEAILIAQLQVRENTNKENIVMMDARRPGGGLKESIEDESIERRLGHTSAFWDIGSFDGLPYYKNGVVVIEIPEKVLEVNGGLFTEDSVKDIIDKYIAYGIYPIIEFVKEDKSD